MVGALGSLLGEMKEGAPFIQHRGGWFSVSRQVTYHVNHPQKRKPNKSRHVHYAHDNSKHKPYQRPPRTSASLTTLRLSSQWRPVFALILPFLTRASRSTPS